MAIKKKTNKKATKLKKTAGKKSKPTKKLMKKLMKKAKAPKKLARKKPVSKASATVKRAAKAHKKKTVRGKSAGAIKKQTRKKRGRADAEPFSARGARSGSGGQSGDLQGLSNIESADSESVDELLEEGNAFEAGIVRGVEDAGDADEAEVHTHEVPEDDVPGEYLDEE
jgi:hypothetical protein